MINEEMTGLRHLIARIRGAEHRTIRNHSQKIEEAGSVFIEFYDAGYQKDRFRMLCWYLKLDEKIRDSVYF